VPRCADCALRPFHHVARSLALLRELAVKLAGIGGEVRSLGSHLERRPDRVGLVDVRIEQQGHALLGRDQLLDWGRRRRSR
jgi:hypothetical protein